MSTAVLEAEARAADTDAGRYWEIDLARTVAILMMAAYHAVYDIDLLAPGVGPDPFRGAWGALPEATGSAFLIVAGVSLAVADGRMRARRTPLARRLRRHLRHAGIVLCAGAVVSLATWLAFDDRFVRFGILQMIGVAIVVGAFAAPLGRWAAVPGAAAIIGGLLVSDVPTGSLALGIVGLDQRGFSSVDHWPLLPWTGPMLIGLALGAALYPRGRRVSWLADRAGAIAPVAALSALGRRSLLVYLTHQLVLIPVVWVTLVLLAVDVPWPP